MRLFVPSLTATLDKRVAIVPHLIERFEALGFSVGVERGAGVAAGFPDAAYGSHLAEAEALAGADLVLTLGTLPGAERLTRGTRLLGLMRPWAQADLGHRLVSLGATSWALEYLPRISRAQSMDALSSQATCAGYRGAILAAEASGHVFPLLTTAAGTLRPAGVLVLGAGVAGLQAIATARRLGAQVAGYDIRPEAREQIRSLGARAVESALVAESRGGYGRELTADEQRREKEQLGHEIQSANVIIAAAFVPGRPAPCLIGPDEVDRLEPGSVIVDLAADEGGNCALSRPGETVTSGGVRILAPRQPAADLAWHASEMYCRNLLNFLKPAVADGQWVVDWSDPVYRETLWTHAGRIRSVGEAPLTVTEDQPP
jgi:NAD(P) transhydrogenase subunit alpha